MTGENPVQRREGRGDGAEKAGMLLFAVACQFAASLCGLCVSALNSAGSDWP